MNKLWKTKNQKELEEILQILGKGIGKVHINEKGEIVIVDKKSKEKYKIGGLRAPTEQETRGAKIVNEVEKINEVRKKVKTT